MDCCTRRHLRDEDTRHRKIAGDAVQKSANGWQGVYCCVIVRLFPSKRDGSVGVISSRPNCQKKKKNVECTRVFGDELVMSHVRRQV